MLIVLGVLVCAFAVFGFFRNEIRVDDLNEAAGAVVWEARHGRVVMLGIVGLVLLLIGVVLRVSALSRWSRSSTAVPVEGARRVAAPTAPAPGWYADDVAGGWRWWDGQAWTNHRSQGAEAVTALLAVVPWGPPGT